LELAKVLPSEVSEISESYYQALAGLIRDAEDAPEHALPARSLLLQCVLAPLQSITSRTLDAYESFIWNILTIPELHTRRDFFEPLVSALNFNLLLKSLAISLDDLSRGRRLTGVDREQLLWLLAYVIFVYQRVVGDVTSSPTVLERDYLAVITDLLSLLAENIGKRVDADSTISVDFIESSRRQAVAPLPPFARQQITSLLNQRNITRLVSGANWLASPATKVDDAIQPSWKDNEDNEAMTLASYVLTLLRAFPRRADDIRMWLYLGSTFASTEPYASRGGNERLPALKYFWSASRRTKVYREISQEPRNAVDLIKQKTSVPTASHSGQPIKSSLTSVQREWRLILVFLELYSFVLKVIDDDEFFADSNETPVHQQPAAWTRESSLPLGDVKNLTIFLKNLGFALHWYRVDESISSEHGSRKESVSSLAQGISSHRQQSKAAPENTNIAGVKGMTIEYLRGTVTGVLRMLYGRE
jgi:ubiquitin-protein ligase E3 C